LVDRAQALLDLGAALRRVGQRQKARDPLAEALDIAHRCGADALVDAASVELRAAGARPRSIVRSGVESLTPSEHRIARLAADGLTNRQIAQALFVTPKTVESHLYTAFRKLDVAARNELAAALTEAE
jgi:DNA-binding CsgD family transcriptional regulator